MWAGLVAEQPFPDDRWQRRSDTTLQKKTRRENKSNRAFLASNDKIEAGPVILPTETSDVQCLGPGLMCKKAWRVKRRLNKGGAAEIISATNVASVLSILEYSRPTSMMGEVVATVGLSVVTAEGEKTFVSWCTAMHYWTCDQSAASNKCSLRLTRQCAIVVIKNDPSSTAQHRRRV